MYAYEWLGGKTTPKGEAKLRAQRFPWLPLFPDPYQRAGRGGGGKGKGGGGGGKGGGGGAGTKPPAPSPHPARRRPFLKNIYPDSVTTEPATSISAKCWTPRSVPRAGR